MMVYKEPPHEPNAACPVCTSRMRHTLAILRDRAFAAALQQPGPEDHSRIRTVLLVPPCPDA